LGEFYKQRRGDIFQTGKFESKACGFRYRPLIKLVLFMAICCDDMLALQTVRYIVYVGFPVERAGVTD
jgi:hypothetical protein